jgi:hypothetical protein
VGSEAAASDLLVGVEDLFAEMGKQHGVPLRSGGFRLATD